MGRWKVWPERAEIPREQGEGGSRGGVRAVECEEQRWKEKNLRSTTVRDLAGGPSLHERSRHTEPSDIAVYGVRLGGRPLSLCSGWWGGV